MWEPQAEALPAGWRMVAPDYRGFGRSSPVDGSPTLDDYAADVVDLMDALHIHDATVAACSMGGYAAFALLRNAPRYVNALVLVDTRAEADTEEGKSGRRKMVEKLDRDGTAAVADDMVPKLLGASTQKNRPELVTHVRRMVMSNPPDALKAAVNAMMLRPDSSDVLRHTHLPALVVAGEEDTLIPVESTRKLQQLLQGSALELLPEAGHLPGLERPRAFNRVLRTFLEGL
jgi:pimeloyl-ACP methyl ester carboxylesterase